MKNDSMYLSHLSVVGFGLIKETLKLYFSNFLPILIVVLLIATPVEIIRICFFVPINYEKGIFDSVGIVSTLFLSLNIPTIIYYLYQKLLGSQKSIYKSIIFGLKKWPEIVFYIILASHMITAGLIFFIIPGFIVAIKLSLLFVIVSVDDTKGIDPFNLSNLMVKGNFWRIIFCLIISSLIVVIPFSIIYFLVFSIFNGWFANIVFDLLAVHFSVFYSAMLLLIYMVIKNKNNLEVESI